MRKTLILILLFFVFSQISCSPKEPYKKSAILMGTFVEIKVVPEGWSKNRHLDSIVESAFNEIRRIENTFSLYNPDSELSRLKTFGIERPYKVSKQFIYLLKKAKSFFELTNGAFDVSLAGTMDKIVIDEENLTVKLNKDVNLDFGAIAKGYAVDRAIYSLRKAGIGNAIVNAGGDMYCLGDGLEGFGWQIGIRDPQKKSDYITSLLIKNKAIATSGDYERPQHIVDPRAKKPVREPLMSVTVLAEDCLTADALATAVFVLGSKEGLELLDKLEGIEGVIISEDSGKLKIEKSKNLKEISLHPRGVD